MGELVPTNKIRQCSINIQSWDALSDREIVALKMNDTKRRATADEMKANQRVTATIVVKSPKHDWDGPGFARCRCCNKMWWRAIESETCSGVVGLYAKKE